MPSRIVGAPICEGCADDISHLIEDDERPDDPILDRVEEITGLAFPECQKLGFEEFVDDLENRLRLENVEAEVEFERRHTGLSRNEVLEAWRKCIDSYRERIRALEDRLTRR